MVKIVKVLSLYTIYPGESENATVSYTSQMFVISVMAEDAQYNNVQQDPQTVNIYPFHNCFLR